MHTNTHIDALHSSKIHSPFLSGSHTLCGQGLGIIMKLGVVSLLEAGGCFPSATCRISAMMADSHLARQDTAGTASVKAFVLCFYFIHFFFMNTIFPFNTPTILLTEKRPLLLFDNEVLFLHPQPGSSISAIVKLGSQLNGKCSQNPAYHTEYLHCYV